MTGSRLSRSDGACAVYGIGQCSLDYLGRIAAYPPPDTKCEFQDLTIAGGGPVATALVALSRWGVSTALSGVIGSDSFGAMIVRSLAAEGVNTAGLIVREGGESQFAFIVAEAGNGRRTVFWRKPTGSPLEPAELDFDAIRKARVFHTDGFYRDASIAGATVAREAGVPVVVDAGSLRPGTADLIALSDYFIASSTFARSFSPMTPFLDVCRELCALGPAVACVTVGAEGSVSISNGKVIEQAAYPVAAVDTTGCGDLFHGGFIYGLLNGWDAAKSFDFASWAAAMVSRELGGRASIPIPSEWRGGR